MISCGIVSYHKENIEYIDYGKKLLKTNDSFYTNIDLIVFCTGYSKSFIDFEKIIDYKYLYQYVIPINHEYKEIVSNLGFIGFNRTYNFLLNVQKRTLWYINNVYYKKLDYTKITQWIKLKEARKLKNNLNFLDSTYELFEISDK